MLSGSRRPAGSTGSETSFDMLCYLCKAGIAMLHGFHMPLDSFKNWLRNARATNWSDRTSRPLWRDSSGILKIFGSKSEFSSH